MKESSFFVVKYQLSFPLSLRYIALRRRRRQRDGGAHGRGGVLRVECVHGVVADAKSVQARG